MQLRLSRFRPWQPMSDREWQVLSGFVLRPGPGRRPGDHRARLDGIFLAACAGIPWSEMGEDYGDPDTLRRQFHRWAREGVFDVLLHAARDRVAPQAEVLRGMEHWLCCAYRRAIPIAGKTVAEVLGYASALRPSDVRRGPSNLSGMIHTLLNSLEIAHPTPTPGGLGAANAPVPKLTKKGGGPGEFSPPSFPLTSPQRAAIRRPLPNTGRGRCLGHTDGPGAACTAPP